MRVILRFVARLLGATLVTTVVLISLTATAAAARTHAVLVSDAAGARLEPVGGAATTPWTVVAWLSAGLVIVAAAGVALTVAGRLKAARVGRSGTSR